MSIVAVLIVTDIDDIIFSHPCKKMQSPEVSRLHCFVACFVRVYSAVAVVSVVAVVQEVCTPVLSTISLNAQHPLRRREIPKVESWPEKRVGFQRGNKSHVSRQKIAVLPRFEDFPR